MVLELGGDLQVLRVREGGLEGGLPDLVVDDWGRGWAVLLLVRDFGGGGGFLGGFCASEGPAFEGIGGFLHESGLDDGADFVQEGSQAGQLAGPETVGAPGSVGGEELCAGRDVLREVGSVLQAEDEGGDEVHGDRVAQSEHVKRFLFCGSGLEEW